MNRWGRMLFILGCVAAGGVAGYWLGKEHRLDEMMVGKVVPPIDQPAKTVQGPGSEGIESEPGAGRPHSIAEEIERISLMPEEKARSEALEELVKGIGPETLAEWVAAVEAQKDLRLRLLVGVHLYNKWREFDESAAIDYLKQADQALQGLLIHATFGLFTYEDPDEAWAWLDHLDPGTALWERGREVLVHQWGNKDFKNASDRLLAMPAEERRPKDLIFMTSICLREGGGQAAIDWLEKVRVTHPERSGEIVDALVHMWSHTAPADTLQWVISQEAVPADLVSLAVRQLTREDPEKTGEYLASISGNRREIVLSSYETERAILVSKEDAARAVAWVEELPDSPHRKGLLIQMAQRWNLTDPAAVDRWLDGKGFSMDEVQSILRFTDEDLKRMGESADGNPGIRVNIGEWRYP